MPGGKRTERAAVCVVTEGFNLFFGNMTSLNSTLAQVEVVVKTVLADRAALPILWRDRLVTDILAPSNGSPDSRWPIILDHLRGLKMPDAEYAIVAEDLYRT